MQSAAPPAAFNLPDTGRPVSFVAGHFAGRTLRADIQELQHATAGRKCATKDRRPLDPPPVVSMRLFEVTNAGTPLEVEQELRDLTGVDIHGFLCHVDLIRVPDPASKSFSSEAGMSDTAATPLASAYGHPGAYSVPTPSALSYGGASAGPWPQQSSRSNQQPMRGSTGPTTSAFGIRSMDPAGGSTTSLQQDTIPSAAAAMTGGGLACYYPRTAGPEPPTALHPHVPTANNQPCTLLLVGTTFVSPTYLTSGRGRSLLYTFSDIAVREEGLFILRYKLFNIFNVALGVAPMPYWQSVTAIRSGCTARKIFPDCARRLP
ncbi:uncharacterized protein B0H18DRAFT_71579 [Fomitopsis serialis]|uniref:uncharacterized protein n=1 Tax=Fomitopsis serialis TaxID=139415 RepID=UPI002007DF0D|nr:uncharacterized protein B0H18DRAFT_71579 [Neoantrodia serialis]KAH9931950.1 hypothetical protein B0H18DRAFT_71579 [Neoantrodia serialis]